MPTVAVRDGALSEQHLAPPVAKSDGIGALQHDLCAAVMAIASHDLRQPLQVIMSAHDALALTIQSHAERAYLARIERAATRVVGIFDQLLDALRLQELSALDRQLPVPLRPIFADLSSEFAEYAELKGIKLRVIPTSTIVYSHPVLLTGILRNLIRNAIDYTPRGGRVLVACRRRGSEVHIEIRDSGAGIATDEVTNVFRAFYRGCNSRADGLGLGLFIVDRAARLLRHRVVVRSAVSSGSCFVVVANAAPGSHSSP